MSLRSIRKIDKDEEITINYIDTSLPYAYRRKELRDTFHFECRCALCLLGIDSRTDRFLSSNATSKIADLHLIEAKAFDSLEDSKKTAARSERPLEALERQIATLRKTRVWPEERQPLPALMEEKFLTLLSQERALEAFQLGLHLHLTVNPSIRPQALHHPLRTVHCYVLAQLGGWVADGPGIQNPQNTTLRLHPDFDMGEVNSILYEEAVTGLAMSHGEDSKLYLRALETQRQWELEWWTQTRGMEHNPQYRQRQREMMKEFSKQ